jgi:hypothetical protein
MFCHFSLLLPALIHFIASDFIPCYGWVIFHCIDIPYFAYLFIRWWKIGVTPLFNYYLIMLWTCWCKFVWRYIFSFLLRMYLGGKLLDHTFSTTNNHFQFNISNSNKEGSNFSLWLLTRNYYCCCYHQLLYLS